MKAYFEFQIVEGFAGNMLWKQGTLIYRKEFEALVRFKRKYSEPLDLYRKIPDWREKDIPNQVVFSFQSPFEGGRGM